MSYSGPNLNGGASAPAFEGFRSATVPPPSRYHHMNRNYTVNFGASTSTSTSTQANPQFPCPRSMGTDFANFLAAQRAASDTSANCHYYPVPNYHQNEPVAPPPMPHSEWGCGEELTPEYGAGGEQQQQEQETPPNFSAFSPCQKQGYPTNLGFHEPRQKAGPSQHQRDKMMENRTTRNLPVGLNQIEPQQDEVEVIIPPPNSEMMGDSREVGKKSKNLRGQVEKWKNELLAMKRNQELAINEKDEVLEMWNQAKQKILIEATKYHELAEERWRDFMEEKKAKEKAERERDAISDEFRHRLSAANDRIRMLNEDILKKDERYKRDCLIRDHTSVKLLSETTYLKDTIDQLHLQLQTVQSQLDTASKERDALKLSLTEKEKEVKKLEENLKAKEAEKESLTQKVLGLEWENQTVKDAKQGVEVRLEVVKTELHAVKDAERELRMENEKLTVEVNDAKILESRMDSQWYEAKKEMRELKQQIEKKEEEIKRKDEEYQKMVANMNEGSPLKRNLDENGAMDVDGKRRRMDGNGKGLGVELENGSGESEQGDGDEEGEGNFPVRVKIELDDVSELGAVEDELAAMQY